MIVKIEPPSGFIETGQAAFLRGFLRFTFKSAIGPRLGVKAQRRWVHILSLLMPGRLGLSRRSLDVNGRNIQIISPQNASAKSVILYLHGGAFCLGNHFTHRSLCSHFAFESGLPVWILNYRLAPEHPYPCALDDAVVAYQELLRQSYAPQNIIVAGDSAGGSLAIALALRLKKLGIPQPACLTLISPVTDGLAARQEQLFGGRGEPMINEGWLAQGVNWLNAPSGSEFSPLTADLRGLPPTLIQVGEEEILLNDSLQLEQKLNQAGVSCRLECHLQRWHVFHLQTLYLRSAKLAIRAMAQFGLSHLPA